MPSISNYLEEVRRAELELCEVFGLDPHKVLQHSMAVSPFSVVWSEHDGQNVVPHRRRVTPEEWDRLMELRP